LNTAKPIGKLILREQSRAVWIPIGEHMQVTPEEALSNIRLQNGVKGFVGVVTFIDVSDRECLEGACVGAGGIREEGEGESVCGNKTQEREHDGDDGFHCGGCIVGLRMWSDVKLLILGVTVRRFITVVLEEEYLYLLCSNMCLINTPIDVAHIYLIIGYARVYVPVGWRRLHDPVVWQGLYEYAKFYSPTLNQR
jgi:hypothetical protein